jgi:hypothetical protein
VPSHPRPHRAATCSHSPPLNPIGSRRAKIAALFGPRTAVDSPALLTAPFHFRLHYGTRQPPLRLRSIPRPQTGETTEETSVRAPRTEVRLAPPVREPDEFLLTQTAALFIGLASPPEISLTLRSHTPLRPGRTHPCTPLRRRSHAPFRRRRVRTPGRLALTRSRLVDDKGKEKENGTTADRD